MMNGNRAGGEWEGFLFIYGNKLTIFRIFILFYIFVRFYMTLCVKLWNNQSLLANIVPFSIMYSLGRIEYSIIFGVFFFIVCL